MFPRKPAGELPDERWMGEWIAYGLRALDEWLAKVVSFEVYYRARREREPWL